MTGPFSYPALRTIYFNITNRCNLKCRHCWIDAKFGATSSGLQASSGELTVSDVKKPIREAIGLGLTSIKFTGGEPFIRKELPDFIRYFSTLDLEIYFETNGTLVDEAVVSGLPKKNVIDIAVSIDSSDRAQHDAVRGVSGSFDKAMRGIELLVRHDLPVQIIYSLYACNLSKLWEAIELARQKGARSFKINPVISLGRAKKIDKGDLLSIEELLDLERQLEEKTYGDIDVFLDIPAAFKSTQHFLRRKKANCCSVTSMLGILSDGTVSICGIGVAEEGLVMGNIKRDSLRDIWSSNDILKRIRSSIPSKLEGVCGRCIHKNFCLGCCIAQNYAGSKRLEAPYHFCEAADKQGLFPETRLMRFEGSNEAVLAQRC
ncbi:MAG: radical SAM protein [Candidatus Omnitrophota bacterium]